MRDRSRSVGLSCLDFYAGRCTDHRGRRLEDIIGLDDDALEREHDFIQWLFPLETPSPVNPSAPLVTSAVRYAFARSESLRQRLCAACARMLRFYGLVCSSDGDGGVTVEPGPEFAARSANWLKPANHNHLRITRILRSLKLLSKSGCSESLYRCLSAIAAGHSSAISNLTLEFWRKTQDK